jgi:hypothetical protein
MPYLPDWTQTPSQAITRGTPRRMSPSGGSRDRGTPALFAALEDALARQLGSDAANFVHMVFRLHVAADLGELLSGSGFAHVNARSKIAPFRLPAPEDFLWQYVHSTPLGAAVAQLDEEVRAALQYEVVAAWQQFTDDGTLILQLGITTASARK